ncbi:facilitated trehalose transporter Tret1-like isoform X2 [Hylaeus volcanicus]|uniref:facilitated trehalose transporter Tret1-like isoform X2 n=1 Tax=Hylaeus volcanicus TaxID=313075 RepID=UPI0023B7BF59|nr:facilitated trehalose transporter Tret1-like isoform X2 [Hylaeus volcanicus]
MATPKIIDTILGVWPQWVACFTVTLLSISLGFAMGWTSPYIAQLTTEGSTLYLTGREASWVASLLPFGRVIGACAGSLVVEYMGSKRALLSAGGPLMIGWICTIVAHSAGWLYISRFCNGLSFGIFFSSFSLYIGEIASPNIRGALITMIVNGMPLGMLIGNTMGSRISMRWFGVISLIVIILYLGFFLYLPRSPYFYVNRNDMEEAKKTIQWYHRKSNVNEELELIQAFVKSAQTSVFRDRLRQIMSRKNRHIFIMVMILFIIMQISGLSSVVFYMEVIVTKAGVTAMHPADVVILAGVHGIIVGWISVYLMDRCSRKLLMGLSCLCIISAMILLGLHFKLLEHGYNVKYMEWMPILAMMLFMMISLGVTPVPSTLLSELFPSDLKGIAGFMASFTGAVFAFICSKTFHPLTEALTETYVFWIHAVLMIISLIYVITNVPETKGKTLKEIQEMLDREYAEQESQEATRRA